MHSTSSPGQPHAFTAEDIDTGAAIAALSAVAVAAAHEIDHLQHALDSGTSIGQAMGLVMATYHIDDTAAWELLKRLSSIENRKLAHVAKDLIHEHNTSARPGAQ